MKQIFLCFLILLPGFASAQTFLGEFPYRRQTQYFDFRSQRDSPQIADIGRFGDGFIRLLNREFFKAEFDYPIRVLVLEDRVRFRDFLKSELHVEDPPNFGIYLPRYKMFVTFEDSGLGTFAHEILHPLVERNLKDRPLWALEGIPTFFEKFYGYWQDDELVAYWGFQNPWRIQQLGPNLTKLDLRQVIADAKLTSASSAVERLESDWRMASVFLWQQGRFKRFLKLIKDRDKAGYPTYFEAAMELPLEKIVPLWQAYLDQVESQRSQILTLPPSTILPDQAAFQRFVDARGILLLQAKQKLTE